MNDTGFVTLEAAEAIAVGQRVFINSSKKAEVAGIGVVASGIAIGDADSGEDISIKMLSAPGTFRVRASEAIVAGAFCFGAAGGEVGASISTSEVWRARQAASADNALFDAELISLSPSFGVQLAPTAETAAFTLTAPKALTRIITITHTTGSTIAGTLDTAANFDTAFPDAPVGFSVDFTIINTSAAAADTLTVTTATGWTLVGTMIVPSAHSTTGTLYGNVASFRARKTGTGAWTLYRIG